MEERVFLSQSCKPTEQLLESALENVYTHYKKIIEIVNSYSQDWIFSKKSGWMLKVHDKKKALFYLIPFKNEIKISLAVRENERKTLIADDELKTIKNMIESAKKYAEGFALQFKISSGKEYQIFELFIKKLITIRS
jgi:hypothetical protein